MRDLRHDVEVGEIEHALAQVEKVLDPGDLLYHLERGVLLHHAGLYVESNAELDQAEMLLEELYTISLSSRALTFVLNDEIEAYAGETHEGSYLHYYRILNFLALGGRESATVEARRLAMRLARLREGDESDPVLAHDPLLEYLCGLVLEAAGEWNQALISYRLASDAFEVWSGQGGIEPFPWLRRDIGRAARYSGIRPEEIGLERDPSDLATDSGRGTIVVLFEHGWTPRKESVHITLPIFEDETGWEGAAGATELGQTAAERYSTYRTEGHWREGEVRVAYVLDVALPTLVPEPPPEAAACRAALVPLPASAGTPDAPNPPAGRAVALPAADLAEQVRREFSRDEFAIFAKTIARALLKYAAQAAAKKEGGDVAGWAVNIAGLATEKADTRSWLMLPGKIEAARLDVAPGTYTLRLEALDHDDEVLSTSTREVTVAGADLQVISWRSFR